MSRLRSTLLIRLAWANVALHAVGLAAAWLWLRPGSLLVPLAERRAYLDTHGLTWGWGWAVWMACAVALVTFNAALVEPLGDRPFLPRLALVLSVAGMAVDLVCDAVQIWLLPGLEGHLFQSFERVAFAGGATVANGLYTLAVALLNVRLSAGAAAPARPSPLAPLPRRERGTQTPDSDLPPLPAWERRAGEVRARVGGVGWWTLSAGWVTVAAGSAMALSGILGSPLLLALATGPTIVGYCCWVVLVARDLSATR